MYVLAENLMEKIRDLFNSNNMERETLMSNFYVKRLHSIAYNLTNYSLLTVYNLNILQFEFCLAICRF